MKEPADDGILALARNLSPKVLWLPALVLLTYILACLLGVTERLPWIDKVFHPVGGYAIAYCVSRSLEMLATRGASPRLGGALRAGFIISMTATAALFWEFAEFAVDSGLAMRFQTDLTDTMSDMALGLVGGIIFLALHRRAAAGGHT